MIKGYIKIVNKASKILENIAAVILFLIAMLVIVNVILRATLDLPIKGTFDLIVFFATVMISLSLAYCAVINGHLAIEFLVERFSRRTQKIISVIIGLISAFFLFVVSWHIYLYASYLRTTGEVSLTIKLPHYPFVIILALGFLMLALVVVGQVLSQFVKEKEGDQK